MKLPPPHIFLLVAVVLALTVNVAPAQESQTLTTNAYRDKVSSLEAMNQTARLESSQLIYKRTLLKAYTRLQKALEEEITFLEGVKSAAEGTDAESQNEALAALQKLRDEHNETTGKIQKLRTNLQLEVAAAPAPREAPPAAAASAPATSTDTPSSSFADFTRPRISAATLTATDAARLAATAAAPTTTPVTIAQNTNASLAVICGQLKPAALVEIVGLIASRTDLPLTTAALKAPLVQKSRLEDEGCELSSPQRVEGDGVFKNGSQKDAVVGLLQTLLSEVKFNRSTYANRQLNYLSRETIEKQIVVLNSHIGNVKVLFDKKGGDDGDRTAMTDLDGNFRIQLPEGEYSISTEADNHASKRSIIIKGGDTTRVNLLLEDRPVSLLARAVVGYEQTGAAATRKEQDYFFDLFVSNPFPLVQKVDPDFGERLRTWASFRVSSVPQTGESQLGAFVSGFATNVSNLQVKDVARVFDFMGGIEYRLFGAPSLRGSFAENTRTKYSISLIAGFGATTPTNPLDSISVFKVFPDAPGLPEIARGKEFIAFVPSDRDRFYRQYYGGIRVQGFYFTEQNMPLQRFPFQFDISVGQNEFVTAGRKSGVVLRMDGYYPLPFEGLKFINLYGTAMMRPNRVRTNIPLVLEPAPAGTVVPAANVALVELPQSNRDHYKAGVGLDFISFVKKFQEGFGKK